MKDGCFFIVTFEVTIAPPLNDKMISQGKTLKEILEDKNMKKLTGIGLIAFIIIYWLMPDLMIGPVDDIIVTLMAGCAARKRLTH